MDPSPGKPDLPPERVEPEAAEEARRLEEERVEQRILKLSIFGAFFFAALGLVWGVLARSQMIKFDALYSSVSVLLAGVSIFAARSMKRGDDERFPFGRAQMEPLVIALKSTAITVLCLIAFVQALGSLFSGGRDINALFAMTYALVCTAGCFGVYLYIRGKRKRVRTSDLIGVESMQWLMDAMLSAAVLAGFLVALILERAGLESWARYLDPLMVIVASTFFIKGPVRSLVAGIREILLMAPEGEIRRDSQKVLEKIAQKRGFAGVVLRLSKTGREFDYKVGFVARDPGDRRSLAELDEIRGEVLSRLQSVCEKQIWLGVSFIHDRRWV